MRTLSKIRAALIPAALLVSVAACDVATEQETAGQYLDDSTITAKVKAGLLKDPTLEKLQIEVETSKQVVQLSGFVNSTATKMHAEEVAEAVTGVKDVKNDLVVR